MIHIKECYNSVRCRWIALPILAHILGWMTGWFGLLSFPVLVTIAQYMIMKVHPSVAHPKRWLITLPITILVWVKWGPYTTYTEEYLVMGGVAAYYAGQLVNTVFIPLVSKPEKPEFLIDWLVANSVAAGLWLALYYVVAIGLFAGRFAYASPLAMFIVYPLIALVANWLSSFFITLRFYNE